MWPDAHAPVPIAATRRILPNHFDAVRQRIDGWFQLSPHLLVPKQTAATALWDVAGLRSTALGVFRQLRAPRLCSR